MTRKEFQLRFWFITLGVFIALVWLLKPILLPFLIGMVLAYFLNPVVEYLSKRDVPRWLSTTWVLTFFVLIVCLLVTLTFPMLQDQLMSLINALPGYVQKIKSILMPWYEIWTARFAPEDMDKLRDAASQSAGEATSWAVTLFKQVISGGLALFDLIGIAIITPIVAFYMLQDWPKIVKSIDQLFPRRYYEVIHARLNEIDRALSGFVRGQALVCLALGFMYSIGLTLTGLEYGAIIGIIAGFLSFIPYVGTTFGWVVSLALAIFQFDQNIGRIFLVLSVFVVGQVVESYYLTPKLVGSRVGLHPVWMLFAIMAGGSLMGFVGVIIAVPVAAIIGVLIRFAVHQYKASPVYKDTL